MKSEESGLEQSGERRVRDPRSNSELLAAALDWTDDENSGASCAWKAVTELHFRGTQEILEGALAFCKSHEPRVRARGADILAQLGCPGRTYPEECLLEMIRLLQQDDHPLVLESAAIALGHQLADQKDSRAIPAILAHKNHSDMNVRHGVAFALAGYNEPESIEALIELMEDPEDLVRDWASFSLGAICDRDSPAIRDALVRRLNDRDDGVRFEALSGLAQRKDLRVIAPLIAALEASPGNEALLDLAEMLLGTEHKGVGVTAKQVIDALSAQRTAADLSGNTDS